MTEKLAADALIEQARQKTGLDDFGGDSFREGLDVLISDVNATIDQRAEQGLARLTGNMINALANRLKITDYHKQRPELARRGVEKPVFVFGIPRTGTTLLSNLLAADPGRRSPLTWEIDDPVPPPTSASLYNDPRALARLEIERKMLAARPEMGKYYRSSAIYPNEDVFIMSNDFKTLMWESQGLMRNYRDWIFSTDVTSAYEYHKRFLQVLQADAPGVWNLKMPSHALYLETLLKVYPDARLIWTHRDPYTATGSFCSLVSLGHGSNMQKPDMEWISANYPWQAKQHADRIMDSRAKIGHDRIVDVHYAELMQKPIETMRKVYGLLGDDFTAAAQSGMQAWLDDNPQQKFGKHEYKLAQFGLSVDTLKPMFERYLAEYDVEPEG